VIDPNIIIGRIYLSTPEEHGKQMRLHIVEALDNLEHSINQDDHVQAENGYGTMSKNKQQPNA